MLQYQYNVSESSVTSSINLVTTLTSSISTTATTEPTSTNIPITFYQKENGSIKDLGGSTGGLSARRLPALNLPPLNTTNDSHHDTFNTPSTSLSRTRKFNCIDIGFSNLTYTVRIGIWKREKKKILNNINGEFKSGELTAIMGPSGAGKSSLMDILAGYTTKNVHGSITINERQRDLKRFRRQSAYIMQDHDLQPYITVLEAMHFSVNLKNGNELSAIDKKIRIKQILEAIGLYESRKTRAGKLSGGQKKRLAIALEIVDNPPVMFFDEPTSGLDSSTSTQVVSLLKKLAKEGRTIICTIHQPSALVFGMFDHLFALAEGNCIYNGDTQYIVPFLADLDLKCPESYNPTDYLLEIATHDYGIQNDRLVAKTENGKNNSYRKNNRFTAQNIAMKRADDMMAAGMMTPVKAPLLLPNNLNVQSPLTPVLESPEFQKKPKTLSLNFDTTKCCRRSDTYATSFCRQFSLLLMRTFLILWRDKSLTLMRIVIHLIVGIFIGILYNGIGNDANYTLNNFRYVFLSIMFTMFTAFSSMSIAFPLELPIIMREHFNRWYSLKAYYVAMTLADAPIQIGCILLYISITYLMTSQPLELFRFSLFFLTCLLAAFVAQSLGLLIGAIFSVKNGAIFGPFFICPFLIFSGFFIQIRDAHTVTHWLFHISFLKYALEAATLAIFGFDRERMDCDEFYCHFKMPDKFLKDIGMNNNDNIVTSILFLVMIFFLFRFSAFYVMSFRLRNKR